MVKLFGSIISEKILIGLNHYLNIDNQTSSKKINKSNKKTKPFQLKLIKKMN